MEQDKTTQDSILATILVIDDEVLIREFLCEVLTLQGYRTLTAQDGLAALGIYKKQFKEIDLVLTDLVMPGMYGAEVLDLMRVMNPQLKAAIMSGYYDHSDLPQECLDNVVGVLRKPFSTVQLHGLLDKALNCGPLDPHFMEKGLDADEEEWVRY
jgi:two-component system cell cycle sensor histidine kinase/response regulator CckA